MASPPPIRDILTLTDKERREFLAILPGRVIHAYQYLYTECDRFSPFDPRWNEIRAYLDRGLILSVTKEGKRAEQYIEGMKAAGFAQHATAGYLTPYTPMQPGQTSGVAQAPLNGAKPEKKKASGFFGLRKREA